MERENGAQVKVLLIDDDPATCRLLRSTLPTMDYALAQAPSPDARIEAFADCPPDVVLLGLGAPDLEGVAAIRRIRGRSRTPIVVLASRAGEDGRRRCLEAGADDYVVKPFSVSELMARIRAVVETARRPASDEVNLVFEFEHLRIDRVTHQVWVAGKDTHLTPIEYKLLCVLADHAGKVVSHRQLLSEVWGAEYSNDTQYVRIYMGYLRRKIELADSGRPLLITEPHVGYRLAV